MTVQLHQLARSRGHAPAVSPLIGVIVCAAVLFLGSARAEPVARLPSAGDVPQHPFLEPGRFENWALTTTVSLFTCSLGGTSAVEPTPRTDVFAFDRARFWFPFAPATAASVPLRPDFGAELRAQGLLQDGVRGSVVAFDASGARYMELEFGPVVTPSISVRLQTIRRSFAVRFLEDDALRVPWPTSPYPIEAAMTFRAEYAVPFAPGGDTPANPARALIEARFGPRDPRSVLGPVALAKTLTRDVIERVRVGGEGWLLSAGALGEVSTAVLVDRLSRPLNPYAGWIALESEAGTAFDLTYALVAVLREARIPARLVLGVRAADDEIGEERVLGRERVLHAWAEFFLMDERRPIFDARGERVGFAGGWIPIDIIQQRNHASPTPPVERPWRFFGNHDRMHLLAPLALHAVPPATSAWFGPPAFYGLAALPDVPGCASHGFAFDLRAPARDAAGFRFNVGAR